MVTVPGGRSPWEPNLDIFRELHYPIRWACVQAVFSNGGEFKVLRKRPAGQPRTGRVGRPVGTAGCHLGPRRRRVSRWASSERHSGMFSHAAGFGAASAALPSRRTGASLPTQVPSSGRPALTRSHLPAAPEAGPARTCSSVPASQRRFCSTVGRPRGRSVSQAHPPCGPLAHLGPDLLGPQHSYHVETHTSLTCQPVHNHLSRHGGRPGEAPRAPAPKAALDCFTPIQ